MDHAHARAVIDRTLDLPDLDRLVATYFDRPIGDTDGFSGAWFERLAGGGDAAEVQDVITADDLVAVTMLSVAVPPLAAKVLLEERSQEFSAMLADIPIEHTIFTDAGRAQLRNAESPANVLWKALDGLRGVGWVTAGKLMARKRPSLIPVWDNVVSTYLGRPRGSWSLFADLFDDGDVVARLEQIRRAADVPDVSLLRVLDVVLWRVGSGHLNGPTDEVTKRR